MVDLADNVGNDAIARLNLLKRAAELGHVGAQRAFPIELQKAQEAQAQVQQQQENNRRAMEVFGHILDGALRR
jgi:hypothetical protein